MLQSGTYTLWIEAENWVTGEWNPTDANTDVILTFDDGSRWVATFFSYANIHTLTEKNRQTGEYLAGVHFWASDMILIDEVSRSHIEEVIQGLIRQGDFEVVFTRLPSAETVEDGMPNVPK